MKKDKKSSLIIVYEEFLLSFILFKLVGTGLRIQETRKIRIYPYSFHFSVADCILQGLSCWGKELGIDLIKESLSPISRMKNANVSDVSILSYRDDDSLRTLTKNVFVIKKSIQKQGVSKIASLLNCRNLLFVSFGSEETSIVRYTDRVDRSAVKVVAESRHFDIQDCLQSDEMLNELEDFTSLVDFNKIYDLFGNISKIPSFDLCKFEGLLIEYLVNIIRLRAFVSCEKLKLDVFKEGQLGDNILVIGGARARLLDNTAIELLSLLDAFNLEGSFTICLDRYGVFDFFQHQDEQILADLVSSYLMLDFWGNIVTIDACKGSVKDAIVADFDIKGKIDKKQIIPLQGRVLSFVFREFANMKLTMRDKFLLPNGEKEVSIKDVIGSFIVDARERPIEKKYDKGDRVALTKGWFKGIGAIS